MSSSADKATKKLKKNQKDGDGDEIPTLTKEETAIAKFLRLSCPNKQGTLVGMKVSFFIGNKLVDCLMESKWGPGKDKDASTKSKSSQTPLFASRQACVSFMQRLMNKQLFYRAVKVYKEPSIKETNREVKDEEKSTPDVRKRVKNSSDGIYIIKYFSIYYLIIRIGQSKYVVNVILAKIKKSMLLINFTEV